MGRGGGGVETPRSNKIRILIGTRLTINRNTSYDSRIGRRNNTRTITERVDSIYALDEWYGPEIMPLIIYARARIYNRHLPRRII